ncbi:MAG TPA: OsmC family protein [Caulobacteraceae bacterium]|jgi:organic hydroperoxide reductase OsmC/OhrA|nr:OsmC family protein [Caulobacteraceae bacterium]
MSEHRAAVHWVSKTTSEDFRAGRYSRAHTLSFDEGLRVPGTPSPQVVPAPWSTPGALDPEGAFVAALSACHMLWFLDLARQGGLVVTAYADAATGTLGRLARGRMGMTQVILRPRIDWDGEAPSSERIVQLHQRAHELCFIANSVTSEVLVEPVV